MTSSAHFDDVKNPLIPPAAKPASSASPASASPASASPASASPASAKSAPSAPAASAAPHEPEGSSAHPPLPDFEKLATNAARFVEQSGKAIAAYMKPFETGAAPKADGSETLAAAFAAIGRIAEHWMQDPARLAEAQKGLTEPFLALWAQTYRRMSGEAADPVVPVAKGDKRYAAPEWTGWPLYDFLRQAHTLGATWTDDLVDRAETVDPKIRAKAKFFLRQITSALSPANFLATNPELLRMTFASNGENLVRGAAILAEDMEAGRGALKIRQTDVSQFELGRNIATTPGKVVFRNDLIELIQYAPTTDTVRKRPLMIVPPWINKFYILDLAPEKSFIRWAVDQGTTVFVLSWVNPDARHRYKTFESYMREGVFAALDAVKAATGETEVDAIGYCVGGTLLASSLAYMAAVGDRRIATATFFAAQADFTDAGDIQVFIDEEQVKALEAQMTEKGYLDGSKMALAFNMLRPTDLLWSYVVSNYMKGENPKAFDLLYWNSDSTRLPALNHSFYLRNFYIENRLAKGELALSGTPLDLGRVTIPIYSLAAKEDHIAPAASVFRGATLFGGEVRYVLAGSGHIAGVINPPAKEKYGYETGPRPSGSLEEWRAQTQAHKGSWWPDWHAWVAAHSPEHVAARLPGQGALPALADAPGEYVRLKS